MAEGCTTDRAKKCVSLALLHSSLRKIALAALSFTAVTRLPLGDMRKLAIAALANPDSELKVNLARWEVEAFRLPEDDSQLATVAEYDQVYKNMVTERSKEGWAKRKTELEEEDEVDI